jgi:Amidohydrolase
VRGVRFSFREALHGHFDEARLQSIIARVEPRRWILDFHIEADDVLTYAEILRKLPLPVIVDHFGSVISRAGINQTALNVLLDLAGERHIWVKFAAHDRMLHRGARYTDIVSVARQIIERSPDRIIWGTDWPHPYVYRHGEVPNDGDLMNMLLDFAPEEATRRKLLADNPARLFADSRSVRARASCRVLPPWEREKITETISVGFNPSHGGKRHMLGKDERISARDLFEQFATRPCRHLRILAKAGAPIRFSALQRMMKNIADEHQVAISTIGGHAEHSRRVPGR